MKIEAHYPEVSQFERGESAYECGFFTVALQKAAGQHSPVLSAEQVDQLADRLYQQHAGANVASNTTGMSLQDWYSCLKEEGIAYSTIPAISIPAIQHALNSGHAVCITVSESSVHDLDTGDRVPYSWPPSGNHIITIVGAEPGVWLCLDTANIGPQGVRPWPRRYDAGKLAISLATSINFSWLAARRTYTVQHGDYLGEIAQKLGIWPASKLYAANEAVLEAAAHAHGHPSSNQGNLIFPGTVLEV
jgi:hypothetical protein